MRICHPRLLIHIDESLHLPYKYCKIFNITYVVFIGKIVVIKIHRIDGIL